MEYQARGVEHRLITALNSGSVVVLEGARATGKTSLANHLVGSGIMSAYRSFADSGELEAAEDSPSDYVRRLGNRTIIDEAQLAESITVAVKEVVDKNPSPGRFLLTGSTRLRRNVLGGSDPLAGRTGPSISLWPMTIGEREGEPVNLVEKLLQPEMPDIPVGRHVTRSDLVDMVGRSGLPDLRDITDLAVLRGRLQAYIGDVTSLKRFAGRDLEAMRRFVRFVAGRTSGTVNISDFARSAEISRKSADEYLAMLIEALLVRRLEAWHSSSDKSAVSTAKLHIFDTGAAAALGGLRPAEESNHLGQLVETLIVNELATQAGWMLEPPSIYHWRSSRGEVDMVIESPTGFILAVEVKTSGNAKKSMFDGIDAFRRANPRRPVRGIVFHSGPTVLPFSDDRWAIPFGALTPRHGPSVGPSPDFRTPVPPAEANLVDSRLIADELARQFELMADDLPDYDTIIRRPPTISPASGVVEMELTAAGSRLKVRLTVKHTTTHGHTTLTATIDPLRTGHTQPAPVNWVSPVEVSRQLSNLVSDAIQPAVAPLLSALGSADPTPGGPT